MSLTSHLKLPKSANDPVQRFFEERFPNTRAFVGEQNRKLKSAETIRMPGNQASYTYATLGRAIDYRIRYYFSFTPFVDLVAWRGALLLVDKMDDDLVWIDAPQYDALAWGIQDERPSSVVESGEDVVELRYWRGRTQKYIGIGFSGIEPILIYGPHPASQRLSSELVRKFFLSLDETVTRINPVARRLERSEEEQLARYCFVLSLLEEGFRAPVDDNSLLFVDGPKRTVAELLSIAEPDWVDDLCSMSWLFYDRYQHILSERVILNPNFDGSPDVGGADADLILDNRLIDIKATINPRISRLILYQILGYAILDYSDKYRIDKVGFYFPRQGETIQWPVSDLLKELSGGKPTTLGELRDSFQAMIDKEGMGKLRLRPIMSIDSTD